MSDATGSTTASATSTTDNGSNDGALADIDESNSGLASDQVSNDGRDPLRQKPANDNEPDDPSKPKPVARKLKVKWRELDENGADVVREQELEEARIVADWQNAKTSTARYQAAARMREEAEQFYRSMQTEDGFVSAAKRIGIDFDKLVEKRFTEMLKVQMMSPEERAAHDRDQQLRQREEKLRAFEQQQQKAQMQHATEQAKNDYQRRFTSALKQAGVPVNPRTIADAASIMQAALQNGQDLSDYELADAVRQEYEQAVGSYIGGMDPQTLLQKHGDVAKRIREADLQRLRTPNTPPSPTAATQGRAENDNGPARKKTWEEIFGNG